MHGLHSADVMQAADCRSFCHEKSDVDWLWCKCRSIVRVCLLFPLRHGWNLFTMRIDWCFGGHHEVSGTSSFVAPLYCRGVHVVWMELAAYHVRLGISNCQSRLFCLLSDSICRIDLAGGLLIASDGGPKSCGVRRHPANYFVPPEPKFWRPHVYRV